MAGLSAPPVVSGSADPGLAVAPAGAPPGNASSWREVCVVIPAFNEEKTVGRVVGEARRALPDAGIVVVDDGSTDATSTAAAEAGAAVVRLPVNLGIGGAVQCGFRYAVRNGFRAAIQIDGDGQHDPGEAERVIGPVLSGEVDGAVGSRWLGRGEYVAPSARRFGMRVLSRAVRWASGRVFTDTTSGFRCVGGDLLRLFASEYPTDFPEVESLVLASRRGFNVVEVPVVMTHRSHGSSSIGGLRSSYYMLRVLAALLVAGVHRPEHGRRDRR